MTNEAKYKSSSQTKNLGQERKRILTGNGYGMWVTMVPTVYSNPIATYFKTFISKIISFQVEGFRGLSRDKFTLEIWEGIYLVFKSG